MSSPKHFSWASVNKHLTSTIIPANLHYNEPNEDIPSLIDGTLKVVNQNTTWNGGLTGINSFGFGGSNDHAIFKSNGLERSISNDDCTKPLLYIWRSQTDYDGTHQQKCT